MQTISESLKNEYPLLVSPTLAQAIGLNEAIVLQQVHNWLNDAKSKPKDNKWKSKDGRLWVYKTYMEWWTSFPWWSSQTFRSAVRYLEKMKLLLSERNGSCDRDHTKWYTIDYGAVEYSLYQWSFSLPPWELEQIEEFRGKGISS